MSDTATCPVLLQPRDRYESWHPRPCGRLLAPGHEKCNLHVKADERYQAKRNEERAAYEANQRRKAHGTLRSLRLWDALGQQGTVSTHWRAPTGSGMGSYTGGVVLDAAAADALLALLGSDPVGEE